MNILGISSVIRRVSHACTKAGDRFYEENILNREFTATAHNQKWCTDVTYLQYGLGAKARRTHENFLFILLCPDINFEKIPF
ncbi:hypothetical protein SAG0309_00915 [Streptococcus agalactiae GB00092]|nr:hypothetical protein SAG0309_00915 [Streptococcus agalactiae GB00092]